MMETKEKILQVRNLSVSYKTRLGVLNALDDVSLDLYRGEVLGLVGESGCGKSTLGKAMMRMIPPPGKITGGQLILDGQDIMLYNPQQMRQVRGNRISMIFQDPMTSLNPVQRIDKHIIEAIRVHEPETTPEAARERAAILMERLGIGRRRLEDYPHQLSGGMRQRVMIGLALALRASVIIADEATTALDVIVEAQFLDLLRELKDEFGLTILMITHNIGIVAELADRVAVMYAGRVVEVADVENLFHHPKHPYTQGLLASVPNINLESELYRMDGTPPNLIQPPSGCRFHPRCPQRLNICDSHVPTLISPPQIGISSDKTYQLVSCWLHQPAPTYATEGSAAS